jgi:hypothetical protein
VASVVRRIELIDQLSTILKDLRRSEMEELEQIENEEKREILKSISEAIKDFCGRGRSAHASASGRSACCGQRKLNDLEFLILRNKKFI